jgi:hypothetical protein|nr:MAG TPA: tail completion protein [Bacteriophage sp.]
MQSRESVLRKLKEYIAPNIYFTPPDDVILKFPACVVTREDFDVRKANNTPYISSMGYKIVYMSKNESDEVFMKIANTFRYSAFRSEYKVNGLYHKVFVVYV